MNNSAVLFYLTTMWNTVKKLITELCLGEGCFPTETDANGTFRSSSWKVWMPFYPEPAILICNLQLIVAKIHRFRQVKINLKLMLITYWHATVAAHLNRSTAVFVKAVRTTLTEWVENLCRHSVCPKVISTDYLTDIILKTKRSVQLLMCCKTGLLDLKKKKLTFFFSTLVDSLLFRGVFLNNVL